MSNFRKCVVLLSGGLDSSTVLAIAKSQGFLCHALTIHYQQRHEVELESARKVAKALGVEAHKFLEIDLRTLGGSALTSDLSVPKNRAQEHIASEIPITYVPARNTVFLSLALAWAEVLDAADIFVGVNAVDYSGYPDCRPEFIQSFENLANLATKAGVEGKTRFKIHAPLSSFSKAEIIREGRRLGLDFSLTHSCYDPTPQGKACGACDSCILRKQGFQAAGLSDPALEGI
ncbi:MAG: 7-cyano-7-deazaguanine synthase QueC [Gemmataceae bacterium]|jgi:7-cyano-7-deazaguanine synthase